MYIYICIMKIYKYSIYFFHFSTNPVHPRRTTCVSFLTMLFVRVRTIDTGGIGLTTMNFKSEFTARNVNSRGGGGQGGPRRHNWYIFCRPGECGGRICMCVYINNIYALVDNILSLVTN